MLALSIRFKYHFIIILCFLHATAVSAVASPLNQHDFRAQTIIDALGRKVTLAKKPQRIITVFSSNTELVAALGLTHTIVGIDALTFYPEAILHCPKIGGRLGLSLEQIIAQSPDLVIMTPARQAIHTLLQPLHQLGIPCIVLNSRNVTDIMDNLQKIADLTGNSLQGEHVLHTLQERLNTVKMRRQNRQQPTVVFITSRLSNGLFLTAKQGSYTADSVTLAGGLLALDEQQSNKIQLTQISPEALLAIDPDIIIYTQREKQKDNIGPYLHHPVFSSLKARKKQHIYAVPSAEFLIPATRIVNGVERLATIFNNWDVVIP